ncbi:unnamed protein product [Pedinophyceae sp. YPF-701]|nr:unnamed protein product [Pedinophyceae sp. YPF-701]
MQAPLLRALVLLGLAAAASAFHVTENFQIYAANATGLNEAGFQGKGIQQEFGKYVWTSWDGNWLVVASGVTTLYPDDEVTTTVESGGLTYFKWDNERANRRENPWVYKGHITPRLAREEAATIGSAADTTTGGGTTNVVHVPTVRTKFEWERLGTCARLANRNEADTSAPFYLAANAASGTGTTTPGTRPVAPNEQSNFNYVQNFGCFDWIDSFAINEDGSTLAYGYRGAAVRATRFQPYRANSADLLGEVVYQNAGVVFVYDRNPTSDIFTHTRTITSSVPTGPYQRLTGAPTTATLSLLNGPAGACGATGTLAIYGATLVMGCPGDNARFLYDFDTQTPRTGQTNAGSTSAGGVDGESREALTGNANVGAVEVWTRSGGTFAANGAFINPSWALSQRVLEDDALRTTGRNFGKMVMLWKGVLLVASNDAANAALPDRLVAYMRDAVNGLPEDPVNTAGAWIPVQEWVPRTTVFGTTQATSLINTYIANKAGLVNKNIEFAGDQFMIRNGATMIIYRPVSGDPQKCETPTGYAIPEGANCVSEYNCVETTTLIAGGTSFAWRGNLVAIGISTKDYTHREVGLNYLAGVVGRVRAANDLPLVAQIRNAGETHYWERRASNFSVNGLDMNFVLGTGYADVPFVRNSRVQTQGMSYFVYSGRIQPASMGMDANCGAAVAIGRTTVFTACPVRFNVAPYAGNSVLIERTSTTIPTLANLNYYRNVDSDDYVFQPSLYEGPSVDPDGQVLAMDTELRTERVRRWQSQLVDAADLLFGDHTNSGFGQGCLANDGDMLLVGAPLLSSGGLPGVGQGVLMNGATGAIMGHLCSKLPVATMAMGSLQCALKGTYAALSVEVGQVPRKNAFGEEALNTQAVGGAVDVFEGTTHVARIFPDKPNANMRFGADGIAITEVDGDVLVFVSASQDDLAEDQNGNAQQLTTAYKQDAGSVQVFKRHTSTTGEAEYLHLTTITAPDTYGVATGVNPAQGLGLTALQRATFARGQRFSQQGFAVRGDLVAVPDHSAALSNNALFYDYTRGPQCRFGAANGNSAAGVDNGAASQLCGEPKPGVVYLYQCSATSCSLAQRIIPPEFYRPFLQAGGNAATNYLLNQNVGAQNPYGDLDNPYQLAAGNGDLANRRFGLNTAICPNGDIVVAGKYPTALNEDAGMLFYYRRHTGQVTDGPTSGLRPGTTLTNFWSTTTNITAYDSWGDNRLGVDFLACEDGIIHASGIDARTGAMRQWMFTYNAGSRTWAQVGRYTPFVDPSARAATNSRQTVASSSTVFTADSSLLEQLTRHDEPGRATDFSNYLRTDGSRPTYERDYTGTEDPYVCNMCVDGETAAFGAVARIDLSYDGIVWKGGDEASNWPQGRSAGVAGIVIGAIVGAFIFFAVIYLLIKVSNIKAKGTAASNRA